MFLIFPLVVIFQFLAIFSNIELLTTAEQFWDLDQERLHCSEAKEEVLVLRRTGLDSSEGQSPLSTMSISEGIPGLHCLLLSERGLTHKPWAARGKNTGKSSASPYSPAWRSRSDAAIGDGNECEEKETNTGHLKEVFPKHARWDFHTSWQKQMLLKGTSFTAPPHRSIWNGDLSDSPSQKRCQHCPAARSALQMCWAPSKDLCCLPCTLPKLIFETSACTYSHLLRDAFVPLLLAFWSPNTWIRSVLVVLGWGQQGSSPVTTAHALSTQEALSESGFTPDIEFSVWTIYFAELAFIHPPPFIIWNLRQT